MSKSIIGAVNKLKRDEKGSVAILFGLSAIAVCMFTGLAIDFGRTYSSKAKLEAAIDAASLAAAKGMRLDGLTETQAAALARTVFDENMKGGAATWTDIHDVRITVNSASSTAHIEVDSSVRTTFGALAGIQRMGSPGAGTAVFESRDVEVAVQLDMTGSMCNPCTKRDGLKTATNSLIDILLPQNPTGQRVRIGFAPFAAGVNAGSYLQDVDGNRFSSKTCVYERQSATNMVSDAAPVGTDAYKIREDLTGWVQDCPAAEIVPLTSDRQKLIDATAAFDANSSTAGHLGASWAWNLISPNWKGIWPSESEPTPYGTANTDKVVILMTDGVYNTIGGVNYGDNSTQAVAASLQSVQMCTAMKNLGIKVYTIGFDLASISNAGARNRATNTLKDCAGVKGGGTSNGYFFNASNVAELEQAFKDIANNIMTLRLSN